MNRRGFITLLGGVAAWPLAAGAQQVALPVMGFMDSGSPVPNAQLVVALKQGLNESGYVEGQNLSIEYRWAEGNYSRLPELATDLVRRQVAVIVATGGELSGRAARAATSTIPIVFDAGGNPVEQGMVASLNRPGGNMTGINQMVEELVTKELGLLYEMVPKASVIGTLVDPNDPTRSDAIVESAQKAVNALGCTMEVLAAGSDEGIDKAFASLDQKHIRALFVSPNAFFYNRRDRIIALAARHAVPSLFVRREFAASGGLMSYGTSLPDAYRQVGVYAGRILKGAKPADLPVVQSTKFDLIINLKTAKALGLDVPPTLLARADEVIE
jgi:putative tryptophan/tyrosine transport system substrate-binding protein